MEYIVFRIDIYHSWLCLLLEHMRTNFRLGCELAWNVDSIELQCCFSRLSVNSQEFTHELISIDVDVGSSDCGTAVYAPSIICPLLQTTTKLNFNDTMSF